MFQLNYSVNIIMEDYEQLFWTVYMWLSVSQSGKNLFAIVCFPHLMYQSSDPVLSTRGLSINDTVY